VAACAAVSRELEGLETRCQWVELAELEEVKGLIAKGERVGVLSYAEIATATAGLDVDEADVEGLHGFLGAIRNRASRGQSTRPRPSPTSWSEPRTSAGATRPSSRST
jgi:hypothetical protein